MTEQRGKKSNRTLEELETLCEQLALRHRILREKLKEVSKMLNLAINEKTVEKQ